MIDKFWRQYQEETKQPHLKYKTAYSFGVEADELAKLVVTGKKCATTSILYSYQREGNPIPQRGEYHIILDSKKNPVAIIKNTKTQIKPPIT